MQVQLGNDRPTTPSPNGAPVVTYINIPDEYTCEDIDIKEVALNLLRNPQVTRLPGQEALITVVHENGAWAQHSKSTPTWAWSDNPVLDKLLREFYEIPSRPADVEDTHYTLSGPPGVIPAVANVKDIQNIIVNQGRSTWIRGLFGGYGSFITGTGTGVTASGYTTGAVTVTSGAWQGCLLVAVNTTGATGSVYANVIDNTAAASANSTLVIDQWYTPGTDGSTPGTTPNASSIYFIGPPSNPAWYMGLNAGVTTTGTMTTSATDVNLPNEITTVNGGLKRKQCAVSTTSVTASGSSIQYTATFTASGTDTLPVGVNGVGLFNTRNKVTTSGFTGMMFETSFAAQSLNNAILNTAGDQLTVTETITGA